MKYATILFIVLSYALQASEPQKQTYKDLLNHFADEAYYREIFRYCSYSIDDPKPEVITYALNLLQEKKDPSLIAMMKQAWQEKGPTLLTQAQQKFEQEKTSKPEILALLSAHNITELLKNKSYFNLKTIETFNTWLNAQALIRT